MRSVLALVVMFTGLLACSALADCSTPAGKAGGIIFNTAYKSMQYCNGTNWVNTGAVNASAPQTGCTTPTAGAGKVIYNSGLGVIQYCNGSSWINTACAATRTPGGPGCTGGKAGTLRYATSVNELQFCDSTNWVAMGWGCSGGSSTPPAAGSCNVVSTWTSHALATTAAWAIAGSADGTKLVLGDAGDQNGGVNTGYLYTSTDGGNTWTRRSAADNSGWISVASSADGTKLYAVLELLSSSSDTLYASTDSGASWTQLSSAPSLAGVVATSPDGTKVATVKSYYWISTNGGSTWAQKALPSGGNYYKAAISSDANTVAIAKDMGNVYTSTNGGTSWTARTTPGTSTSWQSVRMNTNGTVMAVVKGTGSIWISTDSGVNWTQRTPAGAAYLIDIAISSDGTRIAVVDGNPGYIYTSTDTGATWVKQTTAGSRYWGGITGAADGSNYAAIMDNSAIYTTTCP